MKTTNSSMKKTLKTSATRKLSDAKLKEAVEKRKMPLYYKIYYIFIILVCLLIGGMLITWGISMISEVINPTPPTAVSGSAVTGQSVSGDSIGWHNIDLR